MAGIFLSHFAASPEMLLSPPCCPVASGVSGLAFPVNHLINDRQSHSPALLNLSASSLLIFFQLCVFSDYCCFSVSWAFLPHNQFAQCLSVNTVSQLVHGDQQNITLITIEEKGKKNQNEMCLHAHIQCSHTQNETHIRTHCLCACTLLPAF